MAAGDVLAVLWPEDFNEGPSTGFPQMIENAANTGFRNSWDFDASLKETIIGSQIMGNKPAGTGVNVNIVYSTTVAVNAVKWDAAFELVAEDDALGAGGSAFAAAQTVTKTVPGTANTKDTAIITFTSGAQMDSVEKWDQFRLKIDRDGPAGGDTLTVDAKLYCVIITEAA